MRAHEAKRILRQHASCVGKLAPLRRLETTRLSGDTRYRLDCLPSEGASNVAGASLKLREEKKYFVDFPLTPKNDPYRAAKNDNVLKLQMN